MRRNDNSDNSFDYYHSSSDEISSSGLERSIEKHVQAIWADGVSDHYVPDQQQRSSSGGAQMVGGDEGDSVAAPPPFARSSDDHEAITGAGRHPEHAMSPAAVAAAPDTEEGAAAAEAEQRVPSRAGLRRRALSYETGLSELTKRVVRQMNPSPVDGAENNSTSMGSPPEDSSRAATALARIQNRRAGNVGGGGGGAMGRRQPRRQVQQKEDSGGAVDPAVVAVTKAKSSHHRRSSSEPPSLSPRTGSLLGDGEGCNDKDKDGGNHFVEGIVAGNDGGQQGQGLDKEADKTRSVSSPAETPADAEEKDDDAFTCSSLDMDAALGSNEVRTERPSTVGLSVAGGTSGDSSPAVESSTPQSQSELESRALAQNFVMEHRIFLRAILQLLAERDQYAIEADANDPHTIKAGPLKKASHLVRGVWKWKAKYVEIRKGLFSYYENSEGGISSSFNMGGGSNSRRSSLTAVVDGEEDEGAVSAGSGGEENGAEHVGSSAAPELRRKSIPLRAATCTCRAVKVANKALSHTPLSPNGAIFELTVVGGPRRLWMCTTREERQAWIHAIHEAMIGGSVTRGDNFLEYQVERKRDGSASSAVPARSPYRNDLERYLQLQEELRNSTCKAAYVGALADLCGGTESLNVPVQWIKERIEVSSTSSAPNAAFIEGGVSSGVAQLWKDMLRDSVSINRDIYTGDGGHGPERIVGALTKRIMNFDRSATQNVNATRAYRKKFGITEAQAVSYARDILLACNRTRSGGDSYYCMDNLCSNDLVVLCPSSTEAEPLRVTVRHAMNDGMSRRNSDFHGGNDMSGWLQTRSGSQKSWKKRFAVLSEGVLSYYEQAHPRPHGLRGQLLLGGATMGVSQVGSSVDDKKTNEELSPSMKSEQDPYKSIRNRATTYIVCIISKDKSKERQIRFDDQMEFFLWNQAFRDAIQNSGAVARGDRANEAAGTFSRPTNPREGQGIVSLQGASALIAQRLRGLSVRARDGGGSPLRPERWRLARDTESGEGVARESVDANGERDESSCESPTRPQNASRLDTSQQPRSTHWKKVKGGRARSTVEIAVQNSAVYKICTTDPQGDDREDTWAMLQTNFLQNFRLSGGPNGRIMRGEEIVQLNFLEGLVADDAFDRVFNKTEMMEEPATIPRCASSIDVEGMQT